MRAPAAGRSAAGSAPRALSCSVSAPFLPSQRTRTSSSAARSPHAATSRSAWPRQGQRGQLKTRPGQADAESGLGLLGDRAESGHVVHGEIRQHLAVDFDAGLHQAVDDAAVAQAVDARRGIDARDPQGAELALLLRGGRGRRTARP